MHNKPTIFIGALCLAASAIADDAKVVVEPSKDGAPSQETKLTVDTKITFTTTDVQIDNGANHLSFPFAEISRIKFITSTSGVKPIAADDSYTLRRNPVEYELLIAGHDGQPASLSITSINGQTLYRTDSWQGEPVNVESLSAGAYILTINDKTIKFIKK